MHKIFLAGGKTGGPLSPLLSIVNHLDNVHPVIIDTNNSFGQITSQDKNYTFQSLPESKLSILSFNNSNFKEASLNFLKSLWSILIFSYSFLKAIYLNWKYKPSLILTAGGFTAVPLIWANRLTNLLTITNTKIVVHQQDPLPGLSNKLVSKYADIKSCVFKHTKENSKYFKDAEIVSNLLEKHRFEGGKLYQDARNLEYSRPELYSFFNNLNAEKKLLFIYGGFSGADFINQWVLANISLLTEKYNIIHLTGKLQSKDNPLINTDSYVSFQSLDFLDEIPLILTSCDFAISRAGLGSITELLHLKKPSFLVPIPGSHQELNADLSKENFYILEQSTSDLWMEMINKNYPDFFSSLPYQDNDEQEFYLKKYFLKISKLLKD